MPIIFIFAVLIAGCDSGFERLGRIDRASENDETRTEVVTDSTGGGYNDVVGVGSSADTNSVAAADPSTMGSVQNINGSYVSTYKIRVNGGADRWASFVFTGSALKMYNGRGQNLWSNNNVTGDYFGGFDYNNDGWPDIAWVTKKSIGTSCGTHVMNETAIMLLNGRDGTQMLLASPLSDKCWAFPTATYPTSQWVQNSLMFGARSGSIALSPYYASQGFLGVWSGSSWRLSNYFYFSSTSAFDSYYTNDRPVDMVSGHPSFYANSHVANGMLLPDPRDNSKDRLVFFTSKRVVQYQFGPYHSGQLLYDYPFKTGGRDDLVGRNYGLVSVDPSNKNKMSLISGTNAYSLYADMLTGTMSYDPWGQIERHITLYDYSTNQLSDRFFSYAHDGGDAHKYEGRIVYPNNPWVSRGVGAASRLAYNEYKGGRWYLHISEPGTLTDRYALKDLFLWDIQDLDGDGIDEWIVSPTRDSNERDVPGYYFAKWRTNTYHWVESTLTLKSLKTYSGIPELIARFREPTKTTTMSYLYPVNTVRDSNGALKILLRRSRTEVMAESY